MNYVGIDLGTTNSAICSYNGESVHLYKSPEQHDVTPSAIFIDKRGNKYVGSRAYANAARTPDQAAILFKRFMGTSTLIDLPGVQRSMTPEECSAEILRVLFGYLPEEIRHDDALGTVITVPAAFNQMQKDATMSATIAAQIGQVALMQEPVAAVMSVMRQRKQDGVFCVYDLGGGTLDIALAQSIAGRVSLLAHGGIAMCGGRDFDRQIFDSIVKPWLLEHFSLPDAFADQPAFKALSRMAVWAAEKAKIELSQREDTLISLSETELGVRDMAGHEIYLDIPFSRTQFDTLIAPKVDESIHAARETLTKAGLDSHDVERIVFIGGPTQYKPLREKVAIELGIAGSTDVNPMTAVAEGAAIFAESIDWTSKHRSRKSGRGTLRTTGPLSISFAYATRTPDAKTKILAKVAGTTGAVEFQIDSLDTGWSSGRLPLKDGASLDLVLSRPGQNTFKIYVFDTAGAPIRLQENQIIISRTAASIDAIPASHSIAVAAKDKIGGPLIPVYLVREGEPLPKKGSHTFKAEESLKAGNPSGSLNFQLWEGECKDPITDNRFIGLFKITGKDFSDGVIAAGADLRCDYEVLDSGQIVLEVSVPSISGSFHSGRNFYSRQEGQIDYNSASKLIADESSQVLKRLDEITSKIDDPRLREARDKLSAAERSTESDPETAKQALDDIQDVKRLLAVMRQTHLKTIRQLELEKAMAFFDQAVRPYARPSEVTTFENLVRTAQRSLASPTSEFEGYVDELRTKNLMILWRQDWFVIDRFKWLAEDEYLFPNAQEHRHLVTAGTEALNASDMDKLRQIVAQLDAARVGSSGADEMVAPTNIVRS